MDSLPRYVAIGWMWAVLAGALPSEVLAQSTLTGRLVEQFPGDTAINGGSISLHRVDFTGPSFKHLGDCAPAVTVDCVAADGTFNATALSDGIYLIQSLTFPYLFRSVNVTVNGNTNMSDVLLIREPFQASLTIGEIAAAGGLIPVSVRVQTRWNIPTLPITARITTDHEGTNGLYELEAPLEIDVTWLAGLTDSGLVPISPLFVAPSDPAGTSHCVRLVITLQGNPEFEIVNRRACGRKRP